MNSYTTHYPPISCETYTLDTRTFTKSLLLLHLSIPIRTLFYPWSGEAWGAAMSASKFIRAPSTENYSRTVPICNTCVFMVFATFPILIIEMFVVVMQRQSLCLAHNGLGFDVRQSRNFKFLPGIRNYKGWWCRTLNASLFFKYIWVKSQILWRHMYCW